MSKKYTCTNEYCIILNHSSIPQFDTTFDTTVYNVHNLFL